MGLSKVFAVVALCALAALGGAWYLASRGSGPGLMPAAPANMTAAASTSTSAAPALATTTNSTTVVTSATIHTTLGDITISFMTAAAPQTVANFIKLAQSGFYTDVKFHRVIKGFMDQAGDPLTKDNSQEDRWGTGGPGYTIPDENTHAHNGVGVVSMANTGAPNTGGSQFFINAADNGFLDGGYSVFATVTSGLDVVMAINNTPTDSSDRPQTPVIITGITLR